MRKNFPNRKKQRQEEAKARQEAHDKLTVHEKIDKVSRRTRGNSEKEMKRLIDQRATKTKKRKEKK
jgi:hypothetical protein